MTIPTGMRTSATTATTQSQKAYAGNGKPDVGKLCKLNVRTGEVTVLLDAGGGSIRDPQVHYDAQKILFSYRKAGTDYYHLYEIQVDGTGLRQITSGPFDDYEPAYLPDGDIVFVSTRCRCWVNCWKTQVGVLYRCDADGGNLRRLSYNHEHDNTPWVLPDGRILYTRWEYVDRSQVEFHHLWTMNPDGTEQTVFFGNTHPGTLMIDAKPIPGTDDVIASFSPGHGVTDHKGIATIVSPRGGPDFEPAARPASPRGLVATDPRPLRAVRRFLSDGARQADPADGPLGPRASPLHARRRGRSPRAATGGAAAPRAGDPAANRLEQNDRRAVPVGCLPRPQHGGCRARRRSRNCWSSRSFPSRSTSVAVPTWCRGWGPSRSNACSGPCPSTKTAPPISSCRLAGPSSSWPSTRTTCRSSGCTASPVSCRAR